MKRLTQGQYRNSIADVFGGDIEIVGRFAPDYRHERLLAAGSALASLAPADYEQYDLMAREIARQVLSGEQGEKNLGCEPRLTATGTANDCIGHFIAHYGLKLFRRPLTATEQSQREAVVSEVVSLGGSVNDGLQLALASLLVSPDFLFRIETAQPASNGQWQLDSYSRAARLSYFLWNTTPDATLLQAAHEDELMQPAGLRRQVERLLASPRLEQGMRALFTDMLAFDRFGELSKDVALYPAFTPAVADALQEQTLRTLTQHLLDAGGDYRDLFVLDWMPMNRTLGLVYAVPVPWASGWQTYQFDSEDERQGLLSQVSLLSLHAHAGSSSPTLRGRFIRETFLCQPIPPPPADVDFTLDEAFAVLPTARERLQRHRKESTCAACHHLMDPIGLTLEHYDGIGMLRLRENGSPINTAGELDSVAFEGARGLGAALQNHRLVPACFADTVYRYAASGTEIPHARDLQAALNEAFAAGGYQLPALLRAIANSQSFYAAAPATEEDQS
ncbi:DUF1592 domain-containing protein [Parahaliea mediterranea]|uniref:DUF1592 domain-containing protein n=1 Tax=Parahaliea mediterranea TaxID=651086 RepID=UPI0014729CD6|nr:DUF1592 domain-containing protein [Parahaliea mediterranea]